jgi:Methylmalonyl-CoA mutase
MSLPASQSLRKSLKGTSNALVQIIKRSRQLSSIYQQTCRYTVSAVLNSDAKSGPVGYPADWAKLAKKELDDGLEPKDIEWVTPEGINLKPLYTAADVRKDATDATDTPPGIFPFKRGPYATMYTVKP